MASLIEVRDMLALQGRMEAKQLSVRLNTPQPRIDAMLGSLDEKELKIVEATIQAMKAAKETEDA